MIDLNQYGGKNPKAFRDHVADFTAAMGTAGLTIPANITANGKIQRFSLNGKNDKAGWYVLTLESDFAYGAYGDWRSGETYKWCSESESKLTPDQVAKRKASDEALKKQQEEDRAAAAMECRKVWVSAKPAPADFPYLAKKGVPTHDLRIHAGHLIIPMRDNMGEIQSLQRIWPDGFKAHWPGGDPKSHYYTIPGKPKEFYLCEGYATGASIHEATGGTVIVAFQAGNLMAVAGAIKKKYPSIMVTVCADNDQWKPEVGNTGMDKAHAVGKKYGWKVVHPEFAKTDTKPTDFNDLASLEGMEAVRAQIQGEARPSIFDSIFTFDDFMAIQVEPRRVYLAPWIREQDIIQVYGGRGCGKSWFILQALLSITRGVPFGMWECVESVPCMYFDGELIVSDLQDRFRFFNATTSMPAKSEFHFLSNAQRTAQKLSSINLIESSWREELKQVLLSRGIKVWVIDNLASLTPGLDENVKKDWDPINSWLIDLKHSGITTIFLHHTGKGGQQRGTSAREDNIDHSIELFKPANYETEDGCHFISHFTKHRLPRKELHRIIDTDFKLIEDEGGRYTWAYGNVQTEAKKDSLKMLAAGCTTREISERLKVSKTTVSRWKKDAIEDGLIIENGTLTPAGNEFLYGENR